MKPNVGSIDQAFRIVFGLAVMIVGIHYNSWWGAFGLVPLLTGLIRWCPVYLPFHVSTTDEDRLHHV